MSLLLVGLPMVVSAVGGAWLAYVAYFGVLADWWWPLRFFGAMAVWGVGGSLATMSLVYVFAAASSALGLRPPR